MGTGIEANVAAVGRILAIRTILDVVCRVTGMGFAAVARVTEERWIACTVKDDIAFGLEPGGELAVESTLCHEVRQCRQAVVINDVGEDPVYRNHPTPARYGFRSYISMPIILQDGRFFGTLCAIDPRSAQLQRPDVIEMFRLFAELIAFHVDALEQVAASDARLRDEQISSELREQFIAVLGHDLRNPLAAIDAGAQVLLRLDQIPKARRMAELIKASASRMSDLIDNVMDFARGRLGDGLTLNLDSAALLEPSLRQVVAELAAKFPDRVIDVRMMVDRPVACDPGRIAQLLSNLLANALGYGSATIPVRVFAATDVGGFELSVANGGDPIPDAALQRLFQPFQRGAVQRHQQGLGLGLFIASEIARAHGGTLEVESSIKETRFSFRMPLAA